MVSGGALLGRGIGGPLGYGNNANVGDNETPASLGDVQLFKAVCRFRSERASSI